ncbi:MAG: DUF342 domain-containing protein [Spirochaetales bacterium]|nr:DUF342 domain-containing protein [Spirochaetales bacterium]
MPELADLREFMKQKASEDRQRRSVEVEGATMEEALSQATIELALPLRKIEYEILDKGSSGVMGVGKKKVRLLAYEMLDEDSTFSEDGDFDVDLDLGLDAEPVDMDGKAFIRFSHDGVLLKVIGPEGHGKKVTEKQALEVIRSRSILHFDKSLVGKIVKNADGESVKIAEFDHNPVNDALMTVDIRDQDMKGYVTINPPSQGGADISADSILGLLKSNGIIHGIKENTLVELEDDPIYNQPVLIAEGSEPIPGRNARITYNFDMNRDQVNLKEKNGRVDFREMNLIQNVVEGQVLAKKIPADDGTPGRTVTGKLVPTKPGSDVDFELGKNVRQSNDKLTAIAEINGQVIISGARINVEPVYMVQGDVNLKSGGNVIFLGTVIVKGSVADGFKVKAAGNIEVMGNVGKCELDAEGDIIVHQGLNGKGEGFIRAGKGVWAKFIENSRVESGELVVASDGIINSNVDSNKFIICQGKRATIVGGHLRAAEEIRAKTFGSLSGSETILEVGYDPKSSERMAELEKLIATSLDEYDEVDRNIGTLENLKKVKKKLPEEKEEYLLELIEKRTDIEAEREKLEEEKQELKEYLDSLKLVGKISASSRVYPGTKVVIKDASLKIRNEFKAITFINENHEIKPVKFEETDEDFSRGK